MKRLVWIFLAAIAIVCAADNTLRRNTRVDIAPVAGADTIASDTVVATIASDTVVATAGQITVSGYDKPLRSYGESFFVTNVTRQRLSAVILDIQYLDLQGRQLHNRRVAVAADIPAGETRRVDISSWDKRQTFYYHLGPKPRTRGVTPFTVRITPVAFVVRRSAEPADSIF